MRILIGIIVLFALQSCGSGSKNEDLKLSEEQMVAIIQDVRIIEAAKFATKNDTLVNLNEVELYSKVFNKHKVTYEEFKNSYELYLKEPHALRDILEKVEENLHLEKTKLEVDQEMGTLPVE